MEYRFKEKKLIWILLMVFIFTEIVDLLLDQLLGKSFIHSILQLVLFIFLFLVTYRFIERYSRKKINKLLPEELMAILRVIKSEKEKGVLINQKKMRDILNITKPTLVKRVNALLELQYISFEQNGNRKYFVLTELGEALVN